MIFSIDSPTIRVLIPPSNHRISLEKKPSPILGCFCLSFFWFFSISIITADHRSGFFRQHHCIPNSHRPPSRRMRLLIWRIKRDHMVPYFAKEVTGREKKRKKKKRKKKKRKKKRDRVSLSPLSLLSSRASLSLSKFYSLYFLFLNFFFFRLILSLDGFLFLEVISLRLASEGICFNNSDPIPIKSPNPRSSSSTPQPILAKFRYH